MRVKKAVEKDLGTKVHDNSVPRLEELVVARDLKVKEAGREWLMTEKGVKISAEISFIGFETNGDGTIDRAEFKKCMAHTSKALGVTMPAELVEAQFKILDDNRDQRL